VPHVTKDGSELTVTFRATVPTDTVDAAQHQILMFVFPANLGGLDLTVTPLATVLMGNAVLTLTIRPELASRATQVLSDNFATNHADVLTARAATSLARARTHPRMFVYLVIRDIMAQLVFHVIVPVFQMEFVVMEFPELVNATLTDFFARTHYLFL